MMAKTWELLKLEPNVYHLEDNVYDITPMISVIFRFSRNNSTQVFSVSENYFKF